MPYDPNSDMGLSALSPTLSVYKQFVANNGSGKTAAEFLMQQGNSALAMLALKQDYLQNVADLQTKLAQQPQAAPPTVSEDFDAAIAQQDQQTQQALMAQMPQPAPGLPGMPNPVMDQASFAGGGIVAFADGGDVQHFANKGLVGQRGTTFFGNTAGEIVGVPGSQMSVGSAADQAIRMEAALKEALAKLEAAKNSGNSAAVQSATAEVASLRSRIAGLGKLSKTGIAALGTMGAEDIYHGLNTLYTGDPDTAGFVPTEQMANFYGFDTPSSVLGDVGLRTLGTLHRYATLGFGGPGGLFDTSGKATENGVVSNMSDTERAMVSNLMALKKQYGPNSPQVAALEASIRNARGVRSLVPPPPESSGATTRNEQAAQQGAAAPKPTAPAAARPVDLYAKYIEEAKKEAKGEKAFTQEALDRYKTLGIGKAADELEKVISNLRAEYEGPGADKKNMKQSIIEASARMMMGKGGFAEALGEAVGTGVTGYYGRKDKMKDAALGLAKSTYELNQAKENLMLSAAKEGSAEYEKQQKRIQDLKDAQLKHQDDWNKTVFTTNAQLQQARIQAEALSGRSAATVSATEIKNKITALNYAAARAAAVIRDIGAWEPNNPKVLQAYKDLEAAQAELQALGGIAGGGGGPAVSLADYLSSKGV